MTKNTNKIRRAFYNFYRTLPLASRPRFKALRDQVSSPDPVLLFQVTLAALQTLFFDLKPYQRLPALSLLVFLSKAANDEPIQAPYEITALGQMSHAQYQALLASKGLPVKKPCRFNFVGGLFYKYYYPSKMTARINACRTLLLGLCEPLEIVTETATTLLLE
jgi:hypothetical protein